MTIKIYVSNLGKYTEGRENGKWLQLPMDTDKLQTVLNDIVGENQEQIILDYDAPFKIEEFESIVDLNDFMETVNETELTEDELNVLFQAGDTKEEVIQNIMNGNYTIFDVNAESEGWSCSNNEKCGLILHEMGLITTFATPVPEDLVDYIDWENVFDCECINCGWKEITTNKATYLVRI